MRERGISREEVEACIETPDVTYPSDDDIDCVNYVRSFPNGRRIRVVVNQEHVTHKVVVTAVEQESKDED